MNSDGEEVSFLVLVGWLTWCHYHTQANFDKIVQGNCSWSLHEHSHVPTKEKVRRVIDVGLGDACPLRNPYLQWNQAYELKKELKHIARSKYLTLRVEKLRASPLETIATVFDFIEPTADARRLAQDYVTKERHMFLEAHNVGNPRAYNASSRSNALGGTYEPMMARTRTRLTKLLMKDDVLTYFRRHLGDVAKDIP